MNKAELLSLANKGKTQIAGVSLEILVYPSSVDGKDFIEIIGDPFPLHTPLRLGGVWVEYITDEDCAEIEPSLERYKREADEFCEKAKRVVKATLDKNGKIYIIDMPDSVKKDWDGLPPSYLKNYLKRFHPIHYIDDRIHSPNKDYWFAIGKFTLDLDGELFIPHWSYWLDRAYYESTERIKNVVRNYD